MNNQYTTSLIDGATKPVLSINRYSASISWGIGQFIPIGLAEAGANIVIASRKLHHYEEIAG